MPTYTAQLSSALKCRSGETSARPRIALTDSLSRDTYLSFNQTQNACMAAIPSLWADGGRRAANSGVYDNEAHGGQIIMLCECSG